MAISPRKNTRKRACRGIARSPRPSGGLYGHRWRVFRKAWMLANPMCVTCGGVQASRNMALDHIVPHRGNLELFWDSSNLQTLCKTCHDKKTRAGL